MGEMKPTPGPLVPQDREKITSIPLKAIDCERLGMAVCFVNGHREAEAKANAILISEAFKVFHNTGLSPVQLAEMVKELANVLSDARNELTHLIHTHNEQNSSDGSWKYDWQTVCEMDAALAKCEGVGNE